MKDSQSIRLKKELKQWFQKDSRVSAEDQIVQSLLTLGKIENPDTFFHPDLREIPDPFLLKDVKSAVACLAEHMVQNHKILVVGDYDVDGVSSTALLLRFFDCTGYESIDWFIPNRFKHGYGLTDKVVEEVAQKKPAVVITVDHGITSKKEIEDLRRLGIECLVTDHHHPLEEDLPDCLLVNPKQKDCSFPEKEVSGVGVAFLFLIALRSHLREQGYWSTKSQEPNLLDFMDLVALGTVADQVPLTGLNRLFVKYGLQRINTWLDTQQNGPVPFFWRTFADQMGLRKITSETMAFKLAPLINAAGRMEDAGFALRFLLEKDRSQSIEAFRKLDQINKKRRRKQQVMSKKASRHFTSKNRETGFFFYDADFHEGLIGIIANRIVDQHHVPAIVLTDGENGFVKGSCRSKNIDIFSFLQSQKGLFEFFGGHPNAAGLTILKDNIKDLELAFYEFCRQNKDVIGRQVAWGDLELTLGMVGYPLLDKLKAFEPFGLKNQKPVFVIRKMFLEEPRVMAGEHLKWVLGPDVEMVYWEGRSKHVKCGLADIAFTLGDNWFQGQSKLQLEIKAIQAEKD